MTRNIDAVAVFSGSNVGRGDVYATAAAKLGNEIARRGNTIVLVERTKA